MKNHHSILIAFLFLGFTLNNELAAQKSSAQQLAFPNAMGWAATTKGGREGKIIKVTNLKKDGEESFKNAIESNGPRIIVFEVGGIIDLDGITISVKNPFMTIMGQIAPNPGITLIKGGMSLQTHEILPLNPEDYIPRDIIPNIFLFRPHLRQVGPRSSGRIP